MIERKKRIAFVISKGKLDIAYISLNLAATGAGMDCDVRLFFTFYGVDIVHKEKNQLLQVPAACNPAIPSPVPIPNIIGVLPGMTSIYTAMFKKSVQKLQWPPIPEMLSLCLQSGVKMIACAPTLEMMNIKQHDLVEGVEVGGVVQFLEFALDSDINFVF